MLILCQTCDATISDAAERCPKCATPRPGFLGRIVPCGECGAPFQPAYSHCGNCGAPRDLAGSVVAAADDVDVRAEVASELTQNTERANTSQAQSESTVSSAATHKSHQNSGIDGGRMPKEQSNGGLIAKLLIIMFGLGSAGVQLAFGSGAGDSITGQIIYALAYGFTPFVLTYMVAWPVMALRRKPMRGFFRRHSGLFVLFMAIGALSSGMLLVRAVSNGQTPFDARDQQLERELEALRAAMPTKLADGLTMTDVTSGIGGVTFLIVVDTAFTDYAVFSQGLQADFRRYGCSDAATRRFLRHYELPVIIKINVDHQLSESVRIRPSDCM